MNFYYQHENVIFGTKGKTDGILIRSESVNTVLNVVHTIRTLTDWLETFRVLDRERNVLFEIHAQIEYYYKIIEELKMYHDLQVHIAWVLDDELEIILEDE